LPRPAKKSPEKPDASLVLQLQDASLAFGGKRILDRFSLGVPPGHKLSIVGESSCGKSSLLKVMVGLIPPDSGRAILFGEDMAGLPPHRLDRLRRQVGMQFQAGALFDSMTVGQNLLLASMESVRERKGRPMAGPGEIDSMLERVGLAGSSGLSPSSLSGGMRKRVAIARALIVKPGLAIFDEPTAGLDPLTSASIIRLLNELSADLGAAMLLATTDVDVARRFSEDIIILNGGRIWARGSLAEHLASADPYIVNFLRRYARVAVAG
jgi:phospholipid/cholesterol/gamma-HCH transport system ATP-binding protein